MGCPGNKARLGDAAPDIAVGRTGAAGASVHRHTRVVNRRDHLDQEPVEGVGAVVRERDLDAAGNRLDRTGQGPGRGPRVRPRRRREKQDHPEEKRREDAPQDCRRPAPSVRSDHLLMLDDLTPERQGCERKEQPSQPTSCAMNFIAATLAAATIVNDRQTVSAGGITIHKLSASSSGDHPARLTSQRAASGLAMRTTLRRGRPHPWMGCGPRYGFRR